MVRKGRLGICYFCDEYRGDAPTMEDDPFHLLRSATEGTLVSESASIMEDDPVCPLVSTSSEVSHRAYETAGSLRAMFRTLAAGEADDHTNGPHHLARMSGVLRNRKELDRVLREIRPSQAEQTKVQRCMDALKATLKAQELHWTGSVGKKTSLREAYDLDVCVKLATNLVGQAAVEELANRLRSTAFCVVRRERRLVLATYGEFELDLIVEVPDDDAWKVQVQHQQLFRLMEASAKDAVRLLKAWSRLRVRVPGILLESIVFGQTGVTIGSQVQQMFIQALEHLRNGNPCIDPITGKDLLTDTLDPVEQTALRMYAAETLDLQNVQIDVGQVCMECYPCGHDVSLLIGPYQRRTPAMNMNGFTIVELCMRLAMRAPAFGSDPDHFKIYTRAKNLAQVRQTNSNQMLKFVSKIEEAGEIRRQCFEQCEILKYQRLQLRLSSEHPEVQTTKANIDRLCRDHEQVGRMPWLLTFLVAAKLDSIHHEEAQHREAVVNRMRHVQTRVVPSPLDHLRVICILILYLYEKVVGLFCQARSAFDGNDPV